MTSNNGQARQTSTLFPRFGAPASGPARHLSLECNEESSYDWRWCGPDITTTIRSCGDQLTLRDNEQAIDTTSSIKKHIQKPEWGSAGLAMSRDTNGERTSGREAVGDRGERDGRKYKPYRRGREGPIPGCLALSSSSLADCNTRHAPIMRSPRGAHPENCNRHGNVHTTKDIGNDLDHRRRAHLAKGEALSAARNANNTDTSALPRVRQYIRSRLSLGDRSSRPSSTSSMNAPSSTQAERSSSRKVSHENLGQQANISPCGSARSSISAVRPVSPISVGDSSSGDPQLLRDMSREPKRLPSGGDLSTKLRLQASIGAAVRRIRSGYIQANPKVETCDTGRSGSAQSCDGHTDARSSEEAQPSLPIHQARLGAAEGQWRTQSTLLGGKLPWYGDNGIECSGAEEPHDKDREEDRRPRSTPASQGKTAILTCSPLPLGPALRGGELLGSQNEGMSKPGRDVIPGAAGSSPSRPFHETQSAAITNFADMSDGGVMEAAFALSHEYLAEEEESATRRGQNELGYAELPAPEQLIYPSLVLEPQTLDTCGAKARLEQVTGAYEHQKQAPYPPQRQEPYNRPAILPRPKSPHQGLSTRRLQQVPPWSESHQQPRPPPCGRPTAPRRPHPVEFRSPPARVQHPRHPPTSRGHPRAPPRLGPEEIPGLGPGESEFISDTRYPGLSSPRRRRYHQGFPSPTSPRPQGQITLHPRPPVPQNHASKDRSDQYLHPSVAYRLPPHQEQLPPAHSPHSLSREPPGRNCGIRPTSRDSARPYPGPFGAPSFWPSRTPPSPDPRAREPGPGWAPRQPSRPPPASSPPKEVSIPVPRLPPSSPPPQSPRTTTISTSADTSDLYTGTGWGSSSSSSSPFSSSYSGHGGNLIPLLPDSYLAPGGVSCPQPSSHILTPCPDTRPPSPTLSLQAAAARSLGPGVPGLSGPGSRPGSRSSTESLEPLASLLRGSGPGRARFSDGADPFRGGG